MKKLLIVTGLLAISILNSSGQWYLKKYNVSNINLLSKTQLEESLASARKDLGTSGIVAGVGALGIIGGFATLNWGLGDDPSDLEEMLGSDFLGHTYIVLGAGVLTGGIISCIFNLGKIGRIKTVINRNYGLPGSLNISPSIIKNNYSHLSCPGLKLTINF
jgi:hypothetical protein